MCYLISVSAIGFDGSLPEHFRAYRLLAGPTRNPTVLRTLHSRGLQSRHNLLSVNNPQLSGRPQ
jgi:hypothetical protein